MEIAWDEPNLPPCSQIAHEIAQREGVPLSTAAVRQRLSRAARLLEREIQERLTTAAADAAIKLPSVASPKPARRLRGLVNAWRVF